MGHHRVASIIHLRGPKVANSFPDRRLYRWPGGFLRTCDLEMFMRAKSDSRIDPVRELRCGGFMSHVEFSRMSSTRCGMLPYPVSQEQ
ncbi:hypothetical protein M404DRAFT_1005335 [Pisolithus tinctorius Marx 270]|uniref:Uncharacterized protein n=1 Tax=Pisolithus tinctorius Marx 270 TaxID=870435 RepID=A0A0C3INE9_PISTI|nr:hypothetical protein M404DRAFT_1005335 [Pisolithus tinctorius Marx 270]